MRWAGLLIAPLAGYPTYALLAAFTSVSVVPDSRFELLMDSRSVNKAFLCVLEKSDASAWRISVNGVDAGIEATTVESYVVTSAIRSRSCPARPFATLTELGDSSGTWRCQLVLLVWERAAGGSSQPDVGGVEA